MSKKNFLKKNKYTGFCALYCAGIIFLFLILTFPVIGQEHQLRFDVSTSVDWLKAETNTHISYNLAQAGIKLPSGRAMGEETLKEAYPHLIRQQLFPILVDSDTSIGSLIEKRELSLEALDKFCRKAGITPPSLSPDLTRMIGRYIVPMENLSSLLIRHRRPIEPYRPLLPVQTSVYTGIIIIADEELPVHGRNSKAEVIPCLFPKIWDMDMNLVYEKQMLDAAGRDIMMVRYTTAESIFRPPPSGLEGELLKLAGDRPLRIIARQVFGVNTTDPVIDRDDAIKILSTENNRQLLREGKVVFVLNEKTLKTSH